MGGLAAFKFKPFSVKQKKVLTWWMDHTPVHDMDGIIADGAIRSGKTICMSLSYVFWAMESFSGQNFGMCGKTIGSFRRNVVFWLKIMLKSRGYAVEDRRADNLLKISRGYIVNYFYIFGGRDERSQDLIQGITLAGCFFDEVALMPESFVNQATGRCSVEGSKYWFNCNPDGPYHWFKIGWIDQAENKNLLYLHFTMEDNLSLTDEIKRRYRALYTGVFYERYIEGKWAFAEGIIFSNWKIDDLKDEIPKFSNIYNGLDFGVEDPNALIRAEVDNDSRTIYVFDEFYQGNLTLDKLAENVRKRIGNGFVTCDSSGKQNIIDLLYRGINAVPAKKGPNSIQFGIQFLQGYDIVIDHRCKNFIREISMYRWDKARDGTPLDKPVDRDNHLIDALRYATEPIQLGLSGVRTQRRL